MLYVCPQQQILSVNSNTTPMSKDKGILLAGIFILVIAASRFLPHPYNFTPVGAMAIFGGAVNHRKWSFLLLTVLSLYLTDMVMNNTLLRPFFIQEGWIWFNSYMIWVYASFALMFILSHRLLRRFSFLRLGLVSLSGSLLFFLITNFGAWLGSPLYTNDLNGLITSYAAGIPFFGSTLAGDLIYSLFIFGAYQSISSWAGYTNWVTARQ